MLESEHCYRGLCKTDSEVSRNEYVLQIAQGSYKAAVAGGQFPKPSGTGSRELLAQWLRLVDQNTSQLNVLGRNLFKFIYYSLMAAYKIQKHNKKKKKEKRHNLSAIYPGSRQKTYQLTYARIFQTRPTELSAQTPENVRIGGHNYYLLWQFQTQSKIWCTVQTGGP